MGGFVQPPKPVQQGSQQPMRGGMTLLLVQHAAKGRASIIQAALRGEDFGKLDMRRQQRRFDIQCLPARDDAQFEISRRVQSTRKPKPRSRRAGAHRNGPAKQQCGLVGATDAQRGVGALLKQRQIVGARGKCVAVERIGLAMAALLTVFPGQPQRLRRADRARPAGFRHHGRHGFAALWAADARSPTARSPRYQHWRW